MENEILDNQEIFQKQNKTFEEMEKCKDANPNCGAEIYTAYLTSSQALGYVGGGQYKAPAMKCSLCNSNKECRSKMQLHSLGWY